MQYNEKLLEDEVMKRKIKPGYRVLFFGPSGTGKTLTATLLGNQLKKMFTG
jgi:SpoVK/Ycf46/Vps4 family AAA+-type ATPase